MTTVMNAVIKRVTLLAGGLLLGLLLLPLGSTPALGQELVYQPANPAFGGNPVNHRWLRSSADSQNPFGGGGGVGSFRDDPLENFEQNLQRQVLDQLSREIIGDRFGEENIDLTQEGSFNFGRFTVNVTPGPSGISIRVFNKQTGESTTVEIPRF